MNGATVRLGLRLTTPRPANKAASFFTPHTCATKRNLSQAIITRSIQPRIARSKLSVLAANPPSTPSTPSSFFTPSLCRVRKASTTTDAPSSDPTAVTAEGLKNPPASAVVLDWNAFFNLRKSRRRYSLASSILAAIASTGGAFVLLSGNPEMAENITKLIPTDPVISMGIATFGAMFLGWLIGPIFGNAIWRLLHRSRLPEFTIKERAFFERIKRHRVNPSGASANNPVPDFYGEKIGSVSGYRRWLKDQRAFNRKRGGVYTAS